MADEKISELPAATSVNTSDVLPIVQNGTTKKATASLLIKGGGGIGGSISDQQVAFGNGTAIAGDDNLKYDVSLHALTVGTVTLNVNDDGTASFLGGDLVIDGGNGGDGHIWNIGNNVILGDQNVDFTQASVTIDGSGITLFAAVSGAEVAVNGLFHLTPQTAPVSPFEGDIYADSANHHLYYYNGTTWKQLDN